MILIQNIQIPTNKVFGVSFWGPNTFSPRIWMRNTNLEMAEFTTSSMFGDLKGRWVDEQWKKSTPHYNPWDWCIYLYIYSFTININQM